MVAPSEGALLNKEEGSEILTLAPTNPLPSVANVDVVSNIHEEKEKSKSSKNNS